MQTDAGEVDGFRKASVKRKVSLQSGSASSQATQKRQAKAFVNEAGTNIARQCWPLGAIDHSLAAALCPSPIRSYEDSANGRWQVYYPGMASRSRSWAAHGHTEACRQVLEWAWAEVLDLQGLPKSECPITGLFRSGVASAEPEGASGSLGPIGAAASSSGCGQSSAPAERPPKRRKH